MLKSESYLGHTFNNKLKSQSQWEKFSEELEATLSLIVGSQGVTLNYVIREEDVSNYDDTIPYEEAIINAVSVDNNNAKFKVDARTVHQLILLNIHEDSDAYT